MEPPTAIAVDQRDVYQDAAVVLLLRRRDGVGQAELRRQPAARVRQHGETQPMLPRGKVILTHRLRRDADEQRTALAHDGIEIAPTLKLGDAVRAPAAAEEIDDQGPNGQQIGAAHHVPGGIGQGEVRGPRADRENPVLHPRRVKIGHCTLANLKPLRAGQGCAC